MDKASFEGKVKENLERLGLVFSDSLRLGAAVSGGADSLSLLLALAEILKDESADLKAKLILYVINVNHNIRSQEESSGDSDFVAALCRKLVAQGFNVVFECEELARGRVLECAKEREGGIEEAARFLRYQAFESFVKRNSLDFLCLAHNQNDQFETLLMRFLQGSGIENCGIAEKREFAGSFILRPLLNIERREIEAYLKGKGLEWRTDSTNADTSYLRNNIRLNLIPLLDQKFAGWKKALLSGREKNLYDREIIRKKVDEIKILEEGDGSLSVSAEEYLKLPVGIRIRLLVKMCNMAGAERLPFVFLKDVCRENSFFERKIYKNIEISYKKTLISVKKRVKIQTDFAFSAIIEKEGDYDFHFGKMSFLPDDAACQSDPVKGCKVFLNGKDCGCRILLPVLVRSLIYGDQVLTAGGAFKKVNDIFSDWKVPEHKRGQIPLLQEITSDRQQILCIFGQVLGFDNWIVK